MAIREYLCNSCGHEFESVVYSLDPDTYKYSECRCGGKAQILPSAISGVNGVSLSAARPATRVSSKALRKNPSASSKE